MFDSSNRRINAGLDSLLANGSEMPPRNRCQRLTRLRSRAPTQSISPTRPCHNRKLPSWMCNRSILPGTNLQFTFSLQFLFLYHSLITPHCLRLFHLPLVFLSRLPLLICHKLCLMFILIHTSNPFLMHVTTCTPFVTCQLASATPISGSSNVVNSWKM